MEKNTKVAILLFGAMNILFYLIICFFSLEMNPLRWGVGTRIFSVIGAVIANAKLSGALIDFFDERKANQP
jgi:hypothetical protein